MCNNSLCILVELDWLALREIKAAITDDPFGVMRSWNDSLHFCEWAGVTCGRRHDHRVTALDLSSSKLKGTLSSFLGNLSFLRTVYLDNNSFIGTIPPQIGRLHRLQYLYLNNNSFGGEIPSNLSHCLALTLLSVAYNNLVGEIPPGLGSLLNLQTLDLAWNNQIGVIPSSLGNLTSLTLLTLSGNNLIGTIPDSLGRLSKLTVLDFAGFNLSGIVPPSIFNLSLLMFLDLGENQFLGGRLPLHLGTMLPNLQFFSISKNQFTGSIPASISNCSKLDTLSLAANNLQGQVPCLHNLRKLERLTIFDNSLGLGQPSDLDFVSCLTNATMLTYFLIFQNNFEGVFPSIICNFPSLQYLELGGNKINGQIPVCIENLADLLVFSAAVTQLSGAIPSSIGNLPNLHHLYLQNAQFSGQIPSSIGNLTQLNRLFLQENNLEGHIPSALGNYRYLETLDLSQNNLRGRIPLELFNLSLSIGLDLSHNPLTGTLPTEVGQLKNLVDLRIGDTKLSGEIPGTLGACITLESLQMQGNHFQGPIPPTFVALMGLKELDLSRNNLSGKIPNFLVGFPLQMLNLSYNNLEGEVPIGGVFSNKTGLSIVENSGLCGGVHELNLPSCSSEKSRKRRFGHKRRLIIASVSGVSGVGLLVAYILVYVFCLRKRKKEPKGESQASLLNLSYQNILKATDGFSPENLVGSGTFGTVYKSTLDQGKTIVAVKIFNLVQRGASKSFIAECQVLKNTRHRNLVKVITACSSVDYKGNDFKALVYDYLANGSLEDWLHQRRNGNGEGTSAPSRGLNLLQRFDIAVDVAFALEYLHHHSGASIIHCDLKPSNVLLDGEMVAHVSDFGLAKFLSNGITSSHGNQSSSIGVRGTIGYAPPEYGLGNEPSTQGDVYSFGILLLEMLTGKKPTDDMFKDGLSLHGFGKAYWPEGVMEVVDHVLVEDILGEEMSRSPDQMHDLLRLGKNKLMLEALTSVIGIALSCSAELPQERLDMRDVAAKLSTIRNKLLGTRYHDRGKSWLVHKDIDCPSYD